LQVGELIFQSDPADVVFLVELVNDHGTPPSDNYLLRSYKNLSAGCGILVEHIAWQLDDPASAALSDTALSPYPPVLAAWQSIIGLTIEGPDFSWSIQAHVTSAVSAIDLIGPPERVGPPSCEDLSRTMGPEHRYKAGTCVRETADPTSTRR
jgi:hypothetical protein